MPLTSKARSLWFPESLTAKDPSGSSARPPGAEKRALLGGAAGLPSTSSSPAMREAPATVPTVPFREKKRMELEAGSAINPRPVAAL